MYGSFLLSLSFVLITPATCWQYFTTLSEIKLEGPSPNAEYTHSEYYYGDCKRRDIRFLAHVYLDELDVLGKFIVRGWLNIFRIPACIVIRAKSYEWDLFRNTRYNFQICVPRISYTHSQRRFLYFYYEWYIPEDMIGGMTWDLYFFGKTSLKWQ